MPARIRLYEKINGFAEPELEQYIQDYPNSVVMDQVDRRLAEQKWNGLRNSTNIAELEQFAQRFPKSKLKQDAEQKIAELRAAQATPAVSTTYSLLDTGKPSLTGEAKPSPTKEATPSRLPFHWSRIAMLAGGLGVIWLIIASLSPSPIVPTPMPVATPTAPSPSLTQVPTIIPSAEPPPPPIVPRPPPQSSFRTYANYDTNGDVIRYFNSDSSDCQSQCRAESTCIAFSYDKWKGKCYLLGGIGELLIDPKSDTSVRTDQPPPTFSSGADSLCRYNGYSVSGESYRNVQVQTADDCRRMCEPNRDCLASMFSNRSCVMFRNLSGRQSGVSGVVTYLRMQTSC